MLTVVRRPRAALAFAAGAIVVSVVVFGGVWAAGGRHLWRSLVGIHLYHLRLGQGVGAQFWEQFKPWVYEHGYLFVGAALAVVLSKKPPAEGPTDPRPIRAPASGVRVVALVIVAHVAVVLALAEAVFLYVVVIAPLLALLAGMGFDAAITRWRKPGRSSQARPLHASRRVLAGTVAVVTLTIGGWWAASSQREGLDGREYSFWPHRLHAQVTRTLELDPVVQEISESLLPTNGTIFGDPTIVSALALRSGLRVSAELADLNPNWLEAGAIKSEDVVSRIESDGVAAVIGPPFGLVQNPYFKSYLFACYEKPKPFFPPESGPGEALPFLLVFTHAQGRGPCHAPRGP